MEGADLAEQQSALEDELLALESIFGKDVSVERNGLSQPFPHSTSPNFQRQRLPLAQTDDATVITMSLKLKGIAGRTQLLAHIPPTSFYPLQPVLVTVRNDAMPAQVKLVLTAMLNKRARSLVGEPVSRK